MSHYFRFLSERARERVNTNSASVLEQQERILSATAGGYLRNVIREVGVTCAVCATPVYGDFATCYMCGHFPPGAADVVAPLTYAVSGAQAALAMRQYKDGPAELRSRQAQVVSRLLYVGISRHEQCIERLVGQPITRRLTIPSSGGRLGLHPLEAIARGMNAVRELPALVPGSGAVGGREVVASRFDVTPAASRFDGEHILLLDDTWTTGSHTQSAALLLRSLGARHVSIMVVARWIEPTYKSNRAFIRDRLTLDYDPRVCPLTGRPCC